MLTYACNSQCIYCQASSTCDKQAKHMTIPIAKRVCECIMQTPSPSIKIEFQGGEPTLNLPALEFIVEYLRQLNKKNHKEIEFVICTNLVSLTEDQLAFYRKNSIFISTSLDGPPAIHDANRKSTATVPNSTIVSKNISRIQQAYGTEKISALLTITNHSILHLEECIDA